MRKRLFDLIPCVLLLACGRVADSDSHVEPAPLVIEPDLSIGIVEGDSAYLFGAIVSVASDSAGHIYVGDRIGATIRAYDESGRFLKRIARDGQGPGEIDRWPADIALGAGGTIYVRDASRITIFSPREPAGVADSVAAVWPLPSLGNLSSTRGRVDIAGNYLYPGYLFRPDQPPRIFYLPVRDGSPTGDTLDVPPYPGQEYT